MLEYVLPIVEQHVDDAVACLARRGQLSPVVPVAEQLAGALLDAVHLERHTGEEVLHVSRESRPICSLHDQVHMIGLDREVNDAHAARDRMSDLRNERAEDTLRPQVGPP